MQSHALSWPSPSTAWLCSGAQQVSTSGHRSDLHCHAIESPGIIPGALALEDFHETVLEYLHTPSPEGGGPLQAPEAGHGKGKV